MERLSGPLADALRRGRQSFNARFAAASKVSRPIDGAEFQEHLAIALDPIVRGVASESPDRVDGTVDALFDVSLDLFSHGLLGPRAQFPEVPEAWRDLLPSLTPMMAREPGRVAGSVTNAVYNLARTPGARPREWIQALKALGCQTTTELLDCGAVLGWRCGMPAYRMGALEKARSLAPALAARALGLTPGTDVAAVLEKLAGNPWVKPEDSLRSGPKELRIVGKAGAFCGFGGQFLAPPRVAKMDGGIIATDGVTAWRLQADVYNAVLVRCEWGERADLRNDASIQPDGTVIWKERAHRFPELANATGIDTTEDTIIVTLAGSHHIFLVALA